ncbi:MAG TPA: ATP synthase subunit I [Bacillales bacterium]|nr:ATP synthase subunit I [Bacillales bacterium]
MQEFAVYAKKVFLSTLWAMLAVVPLWVILPYRTFLQGLLLGMITSLLNGLITWRKTKQITAAASGQGRRPLGAGMLSRMALAVFAVYLTYRFPDIFSFAGVLSGLFVLQLFSLLHAFIGWWQRQFHKKRA